MNEEKFAAPQAMELSSAADSVAAEIGESLLVRKFQVVRGYLDQLERVRRFLARVESTAPRSDVDYEDDVRSFFQNCWHLRDWITNDKSLPRSQVAAVHAAVKISVPMDICEGMANGTKHFVGLAQGKSAEHESTDTRIVPGEQTVIDCTIYLGAKTISARVLARQCVEEWERILTATGLAVSRS